MLRKTVATAWSLFGLGAVLLASAVESQNGIQFQELTPDTLRPQDKNLGRNPPPGRVVVVGVDLTDNGDGDRSADTNETVEMRLAVYNRTGLSLTGVNAKLSTQDPRVVCIPDADLIVGDLADRELRTTLDRFVFLVADVERTSVTEEFSIQFDIALSADQFESPLLPEQVVIDLDLNLHGGSEPTTFFEGFEAGVGTFRWVDLDADLNPPHGDLFNQEAGLQNSDGYRCQYHDPDWEGSNTQTGTHCYLGPWGAPDGFFFHVTSDRAFSGGHSVHWGIFINESRGFTTPLGQLEAIRLSEPIHLGWQRVCSATRTTICITDLDCPLLENCVPATPTMSIKHQISQVDHRWSSPGPDGLRGVDRAVLHAQLADSTGEPVGDWIKIQPYINAYDTMDNDIFYNCTFDPTDDGNDEGDFFDPTDPDRRLGPSSTCVPERTFVHQGDTDEPFDPQNIGDASDGPGLEGSLGLGTWVEPRFDLSRFAGRRIRIRLLETTIKSASVQNWGLETPVDDGWFIDDVTVTDTLAQPATVEVDTRENLDIKQDFDLDDVGAVCDCAPDDETAWVLPGEVRELTLSHGGGATGSTTLSWSAPSDPGGTSIAYDTIATTEPSDFARSAVCLESDDGTDVTAYDFRTPPGGTLYAYLVRARHACGSGPVGYASSGVPRTAVACTP